MQAEIKLNTIETKELDEVLNTHLKQTKVIARDLDVTAVSKSAGGSYNIGVTDKK